RCQVIGELGEKSSPSLLTPAQVRYRHPAGAEHEGGEPLRLLDPPGSERLEGDHQHLLDEILSSGLVAEAAKAEEADPRRETASERRLGSVGHGKRARRERAGRASVL